MSCKICKSKKLVKITNLKNQPISSVFLEKKNFSLKKYNINLYECRSCKLIQFASLPPLGEMYGQTYGYRTSLSKLMVNHIKKKFDKLIKYKNIKNNLNILDIGSNDGTFLNFFARKNKKFKLYGIDPSAEKFKKYYNKRINLITDYFSYENILKKKDIKKSKFKLITSFAMFYDIDNPNKFCKDIYKLLDNDGIWALEISYFPSLLKNLTYDQICHEHVTYYTLTTFNNLIKKHNLKIIDFNFNEINGGSVEIICAKKNYKSNMKNNELKEYLDDEKNITKISYQKFNQRVENTKKNILEILKIIGNNKNVIGYGASTKGNIVLNHCNITSKDIKYICDANPFKLKKFTPGSNIQIISKEKMRKLNPKYLLVLIWSFRSEVINQEIEFIKKGGKLIFHLPQLHIIDKNNYKTFLNSSFKPFSFDY